MTSGAREVAEPSTPPKANESIQFSFTVPSTPGGYAIGINVTPQKRDPVSPPTTPHRPLEPFVVSTAGVAGNAATIGEDPFVETSAAEEGTGPAYQASTRARTTAQSSSVIRSAVKQETFASTQNAFSQYAVPTTIRERYPADPHGKGWRYQRFYVVIRGHAIGVFYDFWAHVEPLTKVRGARFFGATDLIRAQRMFGEAEAKGETRVI